MSCVIKRVSASTDVADQYLSAASPPAWDVLANAATYADAYAAMADGMKARDSQAGYPPSTFSDRIVIWDTASGSEYAAPRLARLV